MISALASFLMLVLYDGGYPGRVTWTTLMYTMGAVAIARIAIEQNRAYSLGYAAALGAATFVVMVRFVGSPIFCVFILAVIAYLADVIVRDCTIIDESVDSSDQGLIDAGRMFARQRAAGTGANRAYQKKTHQPGRTVMYLAAGALPLFGLGQFFLDRGSGAYAMAASRLLIYLFAALALLVTTSFLGLRRYLRQRGAEMPGDVTASWLMGGLVVTAAVLLVAFLIPRPGSMIASIDFSRLFQSASEQTASRWGWGDEGAERSRPEAATTQDDPHADRKEIHSETAQRGGTPGEVGDGNRDDGPAGKQSGGTEKSSGSQGQQSSPDQTSSREANSQSNQGDQQQTKRGPQQSAEQSSKQQGESQPTNTDQSDSGNRDDAENRSQSEQTAESNRSQSETSSAQPQQSSPSAGEFLSSAATGIGVLLKLIIVAVLAGIVGYFVWQNWERLLAWWRDLWGRQVPVTTEEPSSEIVEPAAPPRPFASFRNPIGSESDPRRVVVITFQAFEAWAREQGARRSQDETPAEFVRRAARTIPEVSGPAAELVNAYNRIVYGRGNANQRDIDTAGQLWQLMRQPVLPANEGSGAC